jgi:hypothetical protein
MMGSGVRIPLRHQDFNDLAKFSALPGLLTALRGSSGEADILLHASRTARVGARRRRGVPHQANFSISDTLVARRDRGRGDHLAARQVCGVPSLTYGRIPSSPSETARGPECDICSAAKIGPFGHPFGAVGRQSPVDDHSNLNVGIHMFLADERHLGTALANGDCNG